MESQEYSLTWKGHAEYLQKSFTKLLEANHLCDVTLIADSKKIGAHKVILSSCSSYFKQVFNDMDEAHPIIILKDVSYSVLKQILNFIYYGQVSVEIDKLSEFLEAAEFLNINGLMKNNLERKRLYSSISEMDSASNTAKNDIVLETEVHNAKKLLRVNGVNNEGYNFFESTKMSDSLPKLQEWKSNFEPNPRPNQTKSRTLMKERVIIGDMLHNPSYYKKRKVKSSPDLQDISESDSQEEDYGDCIDGELDLLDAEDDDYMIEKELLKTPLASTTADGFRCNICHKTYIKKDSLKKHFAVHTKNTTCALCGFTMSRRTHLKRHILNVHQKVL